MLELKRKEISEKGIVGDIWFNNKFICNSLENYYFKIKTGTFKIFLTYSPRFKCILPELEVDGRLGIRIHAGNTQDDSTGCILVGDYIGDYKLANSRLTVDKIIDLIKNNDIREITVL